MAKKRVIKVREPSSGMEFDVSVDDLKDPEVMAAILGQGKEYEEVEGETPSQPQFAKGEGPQDADKKRGEVEGSLGRPVFLKPRPEDQAAITQYDLPKGKTFADLVPMEQYNAEAATMTPAQLRAKYGEGPSPIKGQDSLRDREAQKLGAKDFASLNDRQKAKVIEHLGDASVSDLGRPTLGQVGKAAAMSLTGPVGAALGATSLADTIVPNQAAAEAMQQGVKKLAAVPGQALSALGQQIAPNLMARMNEGQPQAQPPTQDLVGAPSTPTDIPVQEPGQAPAAPQGMDPSELAQLTPRDPELEAIAKKSEINRMLEEDKAKGAIEQNKIKLQEMDRIQARKEKMDESINKARSAYESTVEAINDPSMRVDPDHFWGSRNTGQKIAAAVGMLLGGLGKGPNDAIGIIDRAIAQDLQVQQQNVGHRRAGLEAKARGQLQIMDHLRQQGMDDFTQIKLSSAIAYDNVSRQLEGLKAQAGSQQAAADLDLLNSAVLEKREKNIMEAKERLARIANQESQTEENLAQAEALRGKAVGAGAGKQMSQQQLEEVSEMKSLVDTLKTTSKEFQGVSGVIDKLTALDPLKKTDASKYNLKLEGLTQLVGRAWEGRALTDKDVPRFRAMLAEAGEFGGQEKLDFLIREMSNKLQNRLHALAVSGHDTRGLDALYNELLSVESNPFSKIPGAKRVK